MPAPGKRSTTRQPKRRPGLRVVRRKDSSSLYLDGFISGKRIREALGTDRFELAEEARALRETELFRGAVYGTQAQVTFAEAALSYVRLGEHRPTTKRNVHKLALHFGDKVKCRQINQAMLDKAAAAICPGSKPTTVQRQVVTPVKAILNHAARRGWTDVPRFERIKAGGRRTDWLTPAEAEAVIAAASEKLRPLLVFLLGTGARLGEALALEWRDVDLQHGRATLRATKNGDDRVLTLIPRVVAAMAGMPGERTGAAFRHRKGKAYRRTTGAIQVAYGGQIRAAFRTALRAAGIDRHLTPHHLRHSWATWHYAAHRDLMRLREDGGWKTVAMVERYTKLAPESMAAEIRAHWGGTVAPTDAWTFSRKRNQGQ